MAEVQLNSFIRQYGLKGATLRFVTAYGERENETHAIIALIYKAHERMNPYVIWGDGEQSRDFTYVSDIVDGTIRAAETVSDGSPINLGTGDRIKLNEVAAMIHDILDFHPKTRHEVSKPTGVVSRALDTTRARELLGWEPKVSIREGLERTVSWYVGTHERQGHVSEQVLMERKVPAVIARTK
jgi:UDP-glucose 4-epimerase